MSDNISTREVIELLVKRAGIKKKMASEILRVIPEIVEEGLRKDGLVRVKGLGTFRLKPVRARMGRNPKTGERVEIPAHNRVVFQPEVSFKDYINRDYRVLSYKVIPSEEQQPAVGEKIPEPVPEPEPEVRYQTQPDPVPVPPVPPEPVPETGPPAKKSKIHWIVPTAFFVIVALGLMFYFRTCQLEKTDSHQPVMTSEQPDLNPAQPAATAAEDIQPGEVVSQEPLADSNESAVSSQQPEVSSQQSAVTSHEAEIKTILPGEYLFQLANEEYGNPYLWVLIYKENQDKILGPDLVYSGKELVIPALEGTTEKLTRNDSMAISDGYRLVYEFYQSKGDAAAGEFFKGIDHYKPR